MITQGASAPVYSGHSINFEDAPINVNMDPFTFYQASDGIFFTSGGGALAASNFDDTEGIDGGQSPGGIQLGGGFGITFHFDNDVQELSWQGWAPGTSSPPLGGINVLVFNDGNLVASYQGISPFGGVGDEWFNVLATQGDSFDEITFFNGAFNSFFAYVDNISYNNTAIPEPTTLGLMAMVGAIAVFRRKR
jgi:hypothetical protein